MTMMRRSSRSRPMLESHYTYRSCCLSLALVSSPCPLPLAPLFRANLWPSMGIFLGIDGGGTKTACVVADDSNVLGAATAGGSNVVRLGEETARLNLQAAIQEACAIAGVRTSDVDCAVIGVAGAASVNDASTAIRRIVADLGVRDVEVVGDNVIAMEAAFAGLPGTVVIAGTGSI